MSYTYNLISEKGDYMGVKYALAYSSLSHKSKTKQ